MSEVEQASGLEGRCACGAVHYRLTRAPMFVNCCHCHDCQRQTGSAFAVNALIETACIQLIEGEPVATSMPTDSGRPHDIYRCSACQTALWSDYGRRPALRFVRVGTLNEPKRAPPDAHIFTRSKLPWISLPEQTPAYEVYYDMQTLWPSASLDRRRAILGSG